MTWAGRNPVDYMKRDPARYPILHIKDRKPGLGVSTDVDDKPGPFIEVGHDDPSTGNPFLPPRPPASSIISSSRTFVTAADPSESARISYDYLKSLS